MYYSIKSFHYQLATHFHIFLEGKCLLNSHLRGPCIPCQYFKVRSTRFDKRIWQLQVWRRYRERGKTDLQNEKRDVLAVSPQCGILICLCLICPPSHLAPHLSAVFAQPDEEWSFWEPRAYEPQERQAADFRLWRNKKSSQAIEPREGAYMKIMWKWSIGQLDYLSFISVLTRKYSCIFLLLLLFMYDVWLFFVWFPFINNKHTLMYSTDVYIQYIPKQEYDLLSFLIMKKHISPKNISSLFKGEVNG